LVVLGSHDEQDDRKTPIEFLSNGRNGNKRNASKRGNGKSKKDDDDDSSDKNKTGPNNSSSSNNNGNNSSSVKGGEQSESRRTIAKRELKQTLTENSRMRLRALSGTKESIRVSTDNNSYIVRGGDEMEEPYARIVHIPHPDQVKLNFFHSPVLVPWDFTISSSQKCIFFNFRMNPTPCSLSTMHFTCSCDCTKFFVNV
jgi:hypothetical protein